MEYPGLDKASRTQVWKNFLERGVEHVLTDVEIEQLYVIPFLPNIRGFLGTCSLSYRAEVEINGRQIKNVLKTGQLLACHKSEKLGYGHLNTVLSVERQNVGGAEG